MPWDFSLLVLFLGVVVPWRSIVRMRQLLRTPSTTSEQRLVLYASTLAAQLLVAGVALWRAFARGIPGRALGLALDDPALPLAIAGALCVVMAATQVFALRRLSRLPASEQGYAGILARKLMPQNSVEALAFVALAAAVSVCEEFLYRGFLLAAFARAVGAEIGSSASAAAASAAGAHAGSAAGAVSAGMVSPKMFFAVIASTLLFAVGHVYQGARGVVSTFFLGLLFCALRIGTGSLVPGVAVHFGVDLVAGLAAPRFLARAAAEDAKAAHK